MFDDWYSARPNDLWVEYKYQPKTASINLATSSSPSLSALQYHWGHQRFLEGRNVAVIVGMPYGGVILRHSEWRKKLSILDVEARIIKRKEIAQIITTFVTSPVAAVRNMELWEALNELAG